MVLSQSVASISEGGSSSRFVTVHLRLPSYRISSSYLLLLQPWITPSLFDDTGNPAITDEWTFTHLQERDVARAKLVKHWDTWITEADFQSIAEAGYILVIRCSSRQPPLALNDDESVSILDSITCASR